MSTAANLSELLIIHLRDIDLKEQIPSGQIRNKLMFVVETASISRLLIDVASVSFLSSEGIGHLIMLKKKCDQKEIALALCNISPAIMKVLKLTRCDELFDLFDDQESAIASLRKTLLPAPAKPLSNEAIEILNSRAQQEGNIDAMYELAHRKSDGVGVPEDPVGAVHWYQQAAQQHHPKAQFELATCYAYGLGVERDYTEAMSWYEKAAILGHADAQYMLGLSFQFALNDVSDLTAAKKWYSLAAAQNNEKAKLALETIAV